MTKKTYRVGQIVPNSNITEEIGIPAIMAACQFIHPERFTFHSARMRMHHVTKEELCVQVPSLASIAKVEALIPRATLTASIATIYQMLKALNLEPSLPAAGSLLSAAY